MTLQLLAQVSHDDQLDAPKYKCAVSLDFICAISRSVYVCVCMCVCVTTRDWDWLNYSRELTFNSFFIFTENTLAVIYLPGQWTLILSSICTTSCEATVQKEETMCCHSKTHSNTADGAQTVCEGKLIQLCRCPLVVELIVFLVEPQIIFHICIYSKINFIWSNLKEISIFSLYNNDTNHVNLIFITI